MTITVDFGPGLSSDCLHCVHAQRRHLRNVLTPCWGPVIHLHQFGRLSYILPRQAPCSISRGPDGIPRLKWSNACFLRHPECTQLQGEHNPGFVETDQALTSGTVLPRDFLSLNDLELFPRGNLQTASNLQHRNE